MPSDHLLRYWRQLDKDAAMPALTDLRQKIRADHLADDAAILKSLRTTTPVEAATRARATQRAIALVDDIRAQGSPGLMEVFLAEYGLSTDEGVALMCLAEALLRVPDTETIDDLIDDKITPSAWNEHLGKSSSSLVNASTWALMLTGKVLNEDGRGVVASLKGAIKRLGEPVIRTAVQQAMKEMGRQFVLGQTIDEAIRRGEKEQAKGYGYSYDMLGEAALTAADAARNHAEYAASIQALGPECTSLDIRENPGISIKLSAIHPRYDALQGDRVMAELVSRVQELAHMAAALGMGLNIDAEEADRLDLSLDVIEAVLRDPALAGWDGFGVVVQTYSKRAPTVIDWLYALATELDRKIMVRLVKGAYWDTEIKQAQVLGLDGFPVFSRKEATDVAYICCAKKLLGLGDRIFAQFATHNAHTVASVLEMADDRDAFEFQRLHGMGEALHDIVLKDHGSKCRIYAPVGTHRDLLAYLVRRLLENGANSSFVNQIVSKTVPASVICADPFAALDAAGNVVNPAIKHPARLYGDQRANSRGWDLRDPDNLAVVKRARARLRTTRWQVKPLTVAKSVGRDSHAVVNPADPGDVVGQVALASGDDARAALAAAQPWGADAAVRAQVLRAAADLYEDNFGEFFAVLCREAGKTPDDAVSELREAVDFLRYYAHEGERLAGAQPLGVVSCISPWNFPLAIFTGQIAAALAAGNAVLAKPAEATAIIASIATKLLHKAGVPRAALQLLPGHGAEAGAAITGDARVGGVCFTGSTATAQAINRAMADAAPPEAPLIAETGGINAMIVDSTALPEQAVQDVVMSAFKSAGQRCSALRMLYVQQDVAEGFLQMLYGAMDELRVGDPWQVSSDVGPIIDEKALDSIARHIAQARDDGRLLKQIDAPEAGCFVGPAVISVTGIGDLKREVFGPVLHVATYAAAGLGQIVDDINASGYGLTFGMHSRIDDRVAQVTARLRVGNIYINRNQIGAVVASQPFGGEGLSGTGPKAGGPSYVARFTRSTVLHPATVGGVGADVAQIQRAIDGCVVSEARLGCQAMDGPTGESNQLSSYGRGVILCLGASLQDAQAQAEIVRQNGCAPVIVVPGAVGPGAVDGVLARSALSDLRGFAGVVLWSDAADQRAARVALASRQGAILPLMCERHFGERCRIERHICIDTTAAGGNASLLAAVS
jgi:RHH-type transcriptional regulator, proline utilization regulon repressor / proline dehydrogenase / delta 1-pyrroline-5-carboxylate dehydrogenase